MGPAAEQNEKKKKKKKRIKSVPVTIFVDFNLDKVRERDKNE